MTCASFVIHTAVCLLVRHSKVLTSLTAEEGQVSAIIYITAFLVSEGVTLTAASAAHGENATGGFDLLGDGNILLHKDIGTFERFYNDLAPKEVKYWVSRLMTEASAVFSSPADYAAWKYIPSWYLICKQDRAITPATQRAFVKEARDYLDQARGPGVGKQMLRSEEIDSGHSPFLSRPEETAVFIENAAMACLN